MAGYLLAKRIPLLVDDVRLLRKHEAGGDGDSRLASRGRILELGSGTGLVGIALAHHLRWTGKSAYLHLTDLEDIVPNLVKNVEQNTPLDQSTSLEEITTTLTKDEERDSRSLKQVKLGEVNQDEIPQLHICLSPLDWHSIPEDTVPFTPDPVPRPEFRPTSRDKPPEAWRRSYDLVIAADVLYGKEHPPLVACAAAWALKQSSRARAVIEVPRRERQMGLAEDLRIEMDLRGLELMNEGEEEGWEEMGRDADEGRVTCWWGIWRWKGL